MPGHTFSKLHRYADAAWQLAADLPNAAQHRPEEPAHVAEEGHQRAHGHVAGQHQAPAQHQRRRAGGATGRLARAVEDDVEGFHSNRILLVVR